MKKFNKIIISIMAIIIILTSFNIVKAETTQVETSSAYSGSRNLIVQIDESDINSYVSGGREGFEYVLRKNRPTWLDYEFKTEDKTITFTMSFEFENYENYVKKLTELLGYEPAILYTQDSATTDIVEGFDSVELTNFIKNELDSEGMLVEGNIQDFFTVTNSTLQIGESKYETQTAIDTREKLDIILFSNVSIETVINNISSYTRTISVRVDFDDENDVTIIRSRFETLGEVENSYNNRISVTFEAENLEELSKKTMQALNVSVLITERQEYKTDERLKVTYIESVDTEKLLSENGTISYRVTCPEIYENIAKEEESSVYVNNKIVTLQNRDEDLIFTYERPLTIENIKISTKLTMYGEIERKIILELPLEYATYYKDVLDEKVKSKLTNGMTLNIYDEGIMRCYSIEFKGLSPDRISEKTSQIIGKDELIIDNKYIFFLNSSVKENVEATTVIDGTLQPSQIDFEYILPDTTSKILNEKVGINIYDVTSGNGAIEFTFAYNNYIVLGAIVLVILIIVLIVLIIVRKIKRKLNKNSNNVDKEENKKEVSKSEEEKNEAVKKETSNPEKEENETVKKETSDSEKEDKANNTEPTGKEKNN